MAEKIVKVRYFDGMAYRAYEVGKDGVTEIELQEIARVTIKDYEGKRFILIKSPYLEVFTKSR